MSRAGRIPDSEIAAIRAASPIDRVVSAYLELRPAGPDRLKGLCPFHIEATPSFHVRPDRGLFHCFGCGKGGDVFTFLQQIEHLEFPDAVALAAQRIGYRLRYEGGGPSTESARGTRARLVAANSAAAEFYTARLRTDTEAATAREYLTSRDFDATIIDAFGCGFAPTGWDELTKHLLQQGFSLPELEAAGLSRPGRRGPIDRFRARLLWPIRNASGEVLGFGARRLFDDDRVEAKYLNTPETVLYKKSHVLFGLDHARRPIGDTHQAVIVEGYTDVMAMHAAGITNAVASCGTAFGEHHHYILRRMLADDAPWRAEIIYCFDGDAAGIKAATGALTHVKNTPGRSSVTIAPDGTDPCELRQRDGDEGLHELILARTALIEYVLRAAIAEHDITTVEGRIAAVHHGTTLLHQLPDPITRSEYTRQLAGWVGVDPDAVAASPTDSTVPTAESARNQPAKRARAPGDEKYRWQRTALQAALQKPALAAEHGFDQLPPEVFDQPVYSLLYSAIASLGGARSAPADTTAWVNAVTAHLGTDTGPATELAVQTLHLPGDEPGKYLRAVFTMITAGHLLTRVEILRNELDSVSALDEPERFHHLIAAIQDTEQHRRTILTANPNPNPNPNPRSEPSPSTYRHITSTTQPRKPPRPPTPGAANRTRRPRL
ncbi:DNA primase [Nocardia noduli]|uniref:DNA primase n=1 Tax=Nocardia noduli TaxID=2815722 RepID=UPI001C2186EC|nr:DNA primase [Nocardia noduli]